MDAALSSKIGGIFTLKEHKNGTEGFSWQTMCFRFNPDWLWQELRGW